MKSTEVQKLTNNLMQLQCEAEYPGEKDPFRAYWQGFDDAIELAFKAIKGMLEDSEEERVDILKQEREITSSTYIRAQARMDKEVKSWMGGK